MAQEKKTNKASISEIIKRYVFLIIGLFFSAFGVAVTKRGELGVSPISSVPNVLSYKITALSLGVWLIIWNMLMIAVQVIILRKKFRPVELLQIPVSLLFGVFTDIGTKCVSFIPMDLYIVRLSMVILGTVILGFGIALSVITNVTMNPGEALVKTIAGVTGKKFANVKIIFDISCVSMSIVLSLIFFRGKVVGAREGTAIAAVCTGFVVKFFTKVLRGPLTKILVPSGNKK